MSSIEWKTVTPEEMIRDIEKYVQQTRENKYAFQVGLKDLDFDINEDMLKVLGENIPFRSINQAEDALHHGAIQPTKFIEYDDTEHQVLFFDSRPVGCSGFMGCVTHSLALTDHGLFEIGRYPGVSLSAQNRYWQWFLHRRLATVDEVHNYCDDHHLTTEQFMSDVYQAMVAG